MRIGIVLLLGATIASRPTVPAGVGTAMIGAALAGFAAVHLEATAGARNGGLRLSHVLHDVALTLSLLSLLYTLRPF